MKEHQKNEEHQKRDEAVYPQRKTRLPMSIGSAGYEGLSGDRDGHTEERQKKQRPE